MFAPIRPRPITPSCINTFSVKRPNGCGLCTTGESLEHKLHVTSDTPPEHAVASDQSIGRAVMREFRRRRALEFRDDAGGQNLAQFHAPLVEGVDIPDRALDEDAVFVERDKLAESRR